MQLCSTTANQSHRAVDTSERSAHALRSCGSSCNYKCSKEGQWMEVASLQIIKGLEVEAVPVSGAQNS